MLEPSIESAQAWAGDLVSEGSVGFYVLEHPFLSLIVAILIVGFSKPVVKVRALHRTCDVLSLSLLMSSAGRAQVRGGAGHPRRHCLVAHLSPRHAVLIIRRTAERV